MQLILLITFMYILLTLIPHVHDIWNHQTINKMLQITVPFVNRPLLDNDDLLSIGAHLKANHFIVSTEPILNIFLYFFQISFWKKLPLTGLSD